MRNALPADRVRPDSYRGYSGGASTASVRRWEECVTYQVQTAEKNKMFMEKGDVEHPANVKPIPMKKKLQIAVPKPCQEKYSSFAPTSVGGFCSSCEKEVIDFTSWSDDRIKSYFKKVKGNSCGRFRQDQLKVYSYDNPNRRGIGWISFLFAGFLLLFSSRQVSAQTTPRQTTEQYQPEERKENIKRTKRATITVTGTVTSREDGYAMPGVKVKLKGTSTETLTDAEGKFRIALPNTDSTQLIVFSLKGLKNVEYIHNTARPGQEIAVDMVRDQWDVQVLTGVLGGVRSCGVYVYDPRDIARNVWWWLTGR
jgi:hypothetical protein